MPKVLLVEDDAYLAMLVTDALSASHIDVDFSGDGLEAAEKLKTYEYDVLVLDWELPGLQGIEMLRQFRSRGGTTPTIVITGKRKIDEKGCGFEAGADDYLPKPFNVRELVMRVQALLRRSAGGSDHRLIAGGLILDRQSFTVTLVGEKLDLSRKEFMLLEFFMRRPNCVLSAESLLPGVWGSDADASTETVRTTVGRLRKKLSLTGRLCPLETVHGLGYRFTVD